MNKVNEDFYQRLRSKIKTWAQSQQGKENKWASVVLLAPDIFHLLCKLMLRKDVPAKYKAKIGVLIVYFVLPLDFIPEAIVGPLGYLDDIALSAWALNDLVNHTCADIVTEEWAGEGDILEIIGHVLDVADEMVGPAMWARLVKWWKSR